MLSPRTYTSHMDYLQVAAAPTQRRGRDTEPSDQSRISEPALASPIGWNPLSITGEEPREAVVACTGCLQPTRGCEQVFSMLGDRVSVYLFTYRCWDSTCRRCISLEHNSYFQLDKWHRNEACKRSLRSVMYLHDYFLNFFCKLFSIYVDVSCSGQQWPAGQCSLIMLPLLHYCACCKVTASHGIMHDANSSWRLPNVEDSQWRHIFFKDEPDFAV